MLLGVRSVPHFIGGQIYPCYPSVVFQSCELPDVSSHHKMYVDAGKGSNETGGCFPPKAGRSFKGKGKGTGSLFLQYLKRIKILFTKMARLALLEISGL